MAIQIKNPETTTSKGSKTMSADQFCRWLTVMGINASEAAKRLRVTPNTITAYRRDGADERVKLACRSLARAAGKVRMVDIYEWEEG